MIMPIKVSQLMAISLLLLVGCSDNTNDSNLPGSSSNIPNDQSPSANIPTDQPAPDQNPTDSAIVGSTSVAESDISGCWAREQFTSYAHGGSSYWKETYQLESGGTFRRNHISRITPAPIGQVEPHNDSGEWIIDDGHVVIQFEDRDRVILKVISKYELVQVGSSVEFAFGRC